jgi:hypothetical protein
MGVDQVAAMVPAIVTVLEASRGGEIWCANFSVTNDPARWIQVMPDTLNMPYPFLEPPPELGAVHDHPVLRDLELREWEPHAFATFEIPPGATAAHIASLAGALLRAILGCDGYGVEVSVEKLADPE